MDKQPTYEQLKERLEKCETALKEIINCPDGKSKTWPEIDAIIRAALESR